MATFHSIRFFFISLWSVATVLGAVQDDNIVATVSPPFANVALQAYTNREISTLLRDPLNYNPSWGKTGIAFSVTYYIRNARMAVTYSKEPEDAVRNIFNDEMDIFRTFRAWYDHRNDDSAWTRWSETVAKIFNGDLKTTLERLASIPTEMPLLSDYGFGPKFIPLPSHSMPSDLTFDRQNPFVPLSDQEGFPLIGFGSWTLNGDQCKNAVLAALNAGYRLIDSSENYRNEPSIGEAIRESNVDRKDIFITSKVSFNENYGEKVTTEAFYKTLDNLGTDYLDLYMVHGAISDKVRLKAAWLEMEALVRENKIRFIGVSNFGPSNMDWLMEFATIKPRFVQNKYDPLTQGQQTPWTSSIEQWVANYNANVKGEDEPAIVLQAYGLLNSWPHQVSSVKDGHIEWLAAKYKVSAAQFLVRWALQHGNVAVLVRSTNRDHLSQNLDVFGFEISESDMLFINGLNTMFSPFDIQWMNDVIGQVSMRPDARTKADL